MEFRGFGGGRLVGSCMVAVERQSEVSEQIALDGLRLV